MKRGSNGTNDSINQIISRTLDRTEYELERYCLAFGIRFDDIAAAFVSSATERFGSVLHGAQQRGLRGEVQSVRMETFQVHQMVLPEVESVGHSQDTRSASEAPTQVQGDRRKKVDGRKTKESRNKIKDAAKNRWANMSEKEKNKLLDKMYFARYGKKRGEGLTPAEQFKKRQRRKLFNARYEAKKKGLPVPPLVPKEPNPRRERQRL